MKAYRWTGKRLTPGEGTKRSRMKTLTFLLPVFFALAFLATQIAWAQVGKPNAPLDRHALVTRHNVVLTQFNGEQPLQVGNGEFAFGMDLTGLQTFAPFNTMSQWGWHSSPLPAGTTSRGLCRAGVGHAWPSRALPLAGSAVPRTLCLAGRQPTSHQPGPARLGTDQTGWHSRYAERPPQRPTATRSVERSRHQPL